MVQGQEQVVAVKDTLQEKVSMSPRSALESTYMACVIPHEDPPVRVLC